jgi:hypothetical protein
MQTDLTNYGKSHCGGMSHIGVAVCFSVCWCEVERLVYAYPADYGLFAVQEEDMKPEVYFCAVVGNQRMLKRVLEYVS